jgi:hypothetical protein
VTEDDAADWVEEATVSDEEEKEEMGGIAGD